ncbi:MAG: hypothetical protein GX768_04930 [Chloroflexi bacterium]|jgi:hypothetical protein|nr:hypothetical protein [Chloroflexota bacterium]
MERKNKLVYVYVIISLTVFLLSGSIVKAQDVPPSTSTTEPVFTLEWLNNPAQIPSLEMLEELLKIQVQWQIGEWAHITIKEYHNPIQNLTYDFANTVPENVTTEIWYNLDQNGKVIKTVNQMWSEESLLLREQIASTGKSLNTFTHEQATFVPFEPDYNMGINIDPNRLLDLPGTNQIESGELDGVPVFILTSETSFEGNVSIGDQYAKAGTTLAYFDKTNGLLLRSTSLVTLVDGNDLILADYLYEFNLNATPSLEVLQKVSL